MANIKISDLTAASVAADANEFEINEAGTSKKVTGSQIKAYVNSADGALASKNTVAAADIDSDAVTTAKILDGNVTTAKLAADAVDGTKIADDAIGSEHIQDNAVSASELNVPGNGTAGQYLASDGDGTMTWTDLAAGGGFSNMEVFTSTGTWTNPGTVEKVKVTVVGGGGGGAEGQPLPANGTGTAPNGGTSSFGAYCSATGGYGGIVYRGPGPAGFPSQAYPGAGGIGSGGNLNFRGGVGLNVKFGFAEGSGTLAGGDTYVGSGAVYAFRGPAADVTDNGVYGGGGVMRYTNGEKSATGGGGGTAIEVVTIPTSPVPITIGAGGTNFTTPVAPGPSKTSLASGGGVVIVEY